MGDPAVGANHLLDGSHAFSAWNQDVHQSHPVELAAFKNVSFQHDPLDKVRGNALAKERIGTHAGEQVEQHLGQPHGHAFLGDDRVAAQCRFEASAQRVPLDQGDTVHSNSQPNIECMDAAYALPRVGEQGIAIAIADCLAEELQVAAEVEYVRVGGQNHV